MLSEVKCCGISRGQADTAMRWKCGKFKPKCTQRSQDRVSSASPPILHSYEVPHAYQHFGLFLLYPTEAISLTFGMAPLITATWQSIRCHRARRAGPDCEYSEYPIGLGMRSLCRNGNPHVGRIDCCEAPQDALAVNIDGGYP